MEPANICRPISDIGNAGSAALPSMSKHFRGKKKQKKTTSQCTRGEAGRDARNSFIAFRHLFFFARKGTLHSSIVAISIRSRRSIIKKFRKSQLDDWPCAFYSLLWTRGCLFLYINKNASFFVTLIRCVLNESNRVFSPVLLEMNLLGSDFANQR